MKSATFFVLALLAYASAEVAPEDFFDSEDAVESPEVEFDVPELMDNVPEDETDVEETEPVDDEPEPEDRDIGDELDLESQDLESQDLESQESQDELESEAEEEINEESELPETDDSEDEVAEVDSETEMPQKHFRRAAASCAAKVAFYRNNRIRGDRRRAKERAIIAHIRRLITRLGNQKESSEADVEIAEQFALLETATEEQRKHAETHGRGGVLSLLHPILRKLAREAAHERRIEAAWAKKCDYYCNKAVRHREAAVRRARNIERRAAAQVRTHARLHNLAVGKYRGSVSAYKRETVAFAKTQRARNNELKLLKALFAKLTQLERVKTESTTADVQEADQNQENMGAQAFQNEMVSQLTSLSAMSGSSPAFVEAMNELQRRHPKLRRVRYLLNKIRADIHKEIRVARAKLAATRRSMERARRVMHSRARVLRSKRLHHARTVRARKHRQRQLHRAHLNCAKITGYKAPATRRRTSRRKTNKYLPAHGREKVAVFSHASDGFLRAKPWNHAPQRAVTIMFWARTTQRNPGTVFSYATRHGDNELLVYNTHKLALYVGQQARNLGFGISDGKWHHVAVTWQSSNGRWVSYLDGRRKSSGQGLRKGFKIRRGGSLVLGQEQDSHGGRFDKNQALKDGGLARLAVFERVLSARQIAQYMRRAFDGSEAGLVLGMRFTGSNPAVDFSPFHARFHAHQVKYKADRFRNGKPQ
eukprot:CAMPEP_0114551600 /NCGR_PEP_ID=MMETSP0114-20121206/6691_1 /TAXON_ID=31324 /ORGANISM="Goniomonas sp, Strain m" /LENGTH=708 /DNA_ID=CAMNT_0001736447 /DNA_START=1 /DNA_END=2127 /DNA_ORIENTATION=-